ncbi:hypothetical protein F5Y08DRAFT_306306 [Xylaria arbuscula]|uniref:SPT2 chromatin protein n=1 Tax=Xylaria arbuscula TaxID=114810 RepID=A0A9W8TG36_9PEZI|nr:hypothetical protein F5Y08DRAFT_306306 [Xylaria arbuscula]KAJ3553108.1 hypothetical protein NPX13_g10957 [Xylaria arbuscula]
MPIGDLLAEISGGQPSSAPSPKIAGSSGIKRKAEDGSNGATSTKLTKARQPDGSYSTSKVTRDMDGRVLERSYSVSRPVKSASSINSSTLPHRTNSPSTNGRYEPPTPTSQRTSSTTNGKPSNTMQPKRSEVTSRPKLNQPISAAAKVSQSKPSPTTPTSLQSSQGPPKKGSFKDIMARAAKAQEVMGKVGMIQHKSTDKATIKKERETAKPESKPGVGSSAKGKTGTSYAGTSRPSGAPGRSNGAAGSSGRPVSKAGVSKDAKSAMKSKSASATNDVVEKKVKKSATATTGYAGTARPAPGAAAKKGPSRGDQRSGRGGLLEPPRMNRRNKYEDEYDEDLDDFIDYDDEEDDVGPRYDYDSEGSSDMEAGMSDIDTEERRAEVYAREEDKREQALEEKLKREKEERRRRWAQGGR